LSSRGAVSQLSKAAFTNFSSKPLYETPLGRNSESR
jgi:hypothetical protein